LRNPIITPTVPPDLPPDLRDEVTREVEQRKTLQTASITEFSLDDVFRQIEKSRATIYTIIPGIRLLGLSHDEQLRRLRSKDDKTVATWEEATPAKTKEVSEAREEQRRKRLLPQMLEATLEEELEVQSTLFEVATTSGGWAEFLEAQSQATAIYARILADLNERYIVGYYPTNKQRDGTRRQINIEVKGHPEYVISGRKSYYAPED